MNQQASGLLAFSVVGASASWFDPQQGNRAPKLFASCCPLFVTYRRPLVEQIQIIFPRSVLMVVNFNSIVYGCVLVGCIALEL